MITDEQSEQAPEWTAIYFIKLAENEMKCNVCSVILKTEKLPDLYDHIKVNHKDVIELHKDPGTTQVGFRIEFLHLNVTDDGDPKTQPVLLGEVCEATTETMVEKGEEISIKPDDSNLHFVILDGKTTKKSRRESSGEYLNLILILSTKI